MAKQLERHLNILQHFPRPPAYITAAQLHERLPHDLNVTKRTVERDLKQMSASFPDALEMVEGQGDNGRAIHWRLRFRQGLLPETFLNNPDLAMTLSLLEQQARSRLPRAVLDRLRPYWEQARTAHKHNAQTQRWQRDFQYLPDPMRPEPPSVDPEIQHTVEDALANAQRLTVTLETLDGSLTYARLLALRLILQEEVLYMLVENLETDDPEASLVLLPLHRVTHATASGLASGSGIEPDLAQQHLLGTGEFITLEMRVSRNLAEALFERPIGHGQRIHIDGERYRVITEIEDSPQLHRWLQRRASEIEHP